MLIENPIPNMYFIPLNYYHSFEYNYLSEVQTEIINPINIHSQVKSIRQLKTKPNPDINYTEVECVICLELIDIFISYSGDNKSKDYCGLKKLLNKIGLGVQSNSSNNNFSCLECGHIYHTQCIVQWCNKKNHCPLCRKIVIK